MHGRRDAKTEQEMIDLFCQYLILILMNEPIPSGFKVNPINQPGVTEFYNTCQMQIKATARTKS